MATTADESLNWAQFQVAEAARRLHARAAEREDLHLDVRPPQHTHFIVLHSVRGRIALGSPVGHCYISGVTEVGDPSPILYSRCNDSMAEGYADTFIDGSVHGFYCEDEHHVVFAAPDVTHYTIVWFTPGPGSPRPGGLAVVPRD